MDERLSDELIPAGVESGDTAGSNWGIKPGWLKAGSIASGAILAAAGFGGVVAAAEHPAATTDLDADGPALDSGPFLTPTAGWLVDSPDGSTIRTPHGAQSPRSARSAATPPTPVTPATPPTAESPATVPSPMTPASAPTTTDLSTDAQTAATAGTAATTGTVATAGTVETAATATAGTGATAGSPTLTTAQVAWLDFLAASGFTVDDLRAMSAEDLDALAAGLGIDPAVLRDLVDALD